MCFNPSLGVELMDCLYSRNTLNSLTKLLISQDYDEYIKEMMRRDLDLDLDLDLDKSLGRANI